MPTPTTLIAYSTVDGQTLRICTRLQQSLERLGVSADLADLHGSTAIDPGPYDRIVIGASIRYGKHRPEVHRFVEAHREALDRKPSAFFSVNVVARKPGKDTPATNAYVRSFLNKARWQPREVGVFAGLIDYPRYSLFDRQVIRLIMWITKGPTDPTACFEFTDWQAVELFAQRVAAMGRASPGDAGRPARRVDAAG